MIIIIGILAAIAIPMFLNQRDKAKDATVKGGVHNIELGVASYADRPRRHVSGDWGGRASRLSLASLRGQLAGESLDRERHEGGTAKGTTPTR